MKLKIICGQLEITPGRPDVNYKKIIDAIEKARSLEADILLLPEMALPGYLISDIWEQQTFLDDCAYYAEKIVAAFGTDSLKILEAAPERLTEIDGISRKKALEIGASFRQQVAVRRLIEFLAGYRIPAQVAVRLYRVYGAQSLGRVQEDPYLLAQPQFGAGFGAADQLALELFLSCATISQTDIPFSRRTSSLRQRPSC